VSARISHSDRGRGQIGVRAPARLGPGCAPGAADRRGERPPGAADHQVELRHAYLEIAVVECPAPDRGLAAHGIEPGAVEEGRSQGMAGERLVEPGDRGGGRGARHGDARVCGVPRPQQLSNMFLPRPPG
jgi:hypothetical protein